MKIKTNSKIAEAHPSLSATIQNINGLNYPLKGWYMQNGLKNTWSNYMYSKTDSFYNQHIDIEIEGIGENILCK